jgi:thiamine transport system permease protein
MDADSAEIGGRSRAAFGARAARACLAAAPVLFLLLFLGYPLARILALGFAPVASTGLAALRQLAVDTDLGPLIVSSAVQALLSTLLTLAVGLPIAWIFATYRFPGKALLRALLMIPFVLPTVVVGSGFAALIGSGGMLERLLSLVTGSGSIQLSLMRTLPAVLLAHVFYNVSIVVRIVGGAWSALDPRMRDAARVLGAGRLAAFSRVTFRLLLPSIAAASMLVFAFCFSSFGVILILGGPRISTLETEIYRQAVYMFNLPAAALLSAFQLTVTAAVMFAYSRLQARSSAIQKLRPQGFTARMPRATSEWMLVALCGIVPTIGLLLPMATLLLGSFSTHSGPGFAYWKALFSPAGHSLFWISPALAAANSLLFASEAAILALALGVPTAYLLSRRPGVHSRARAMAFTTLDILFLLPLGTSAVTLGFGFIVGFNGPPLDFQGAWVLIPVAHALVALPLVIRSLLPSLRAIDPRMREAASILGASAIRVRREIDFPVLRRAFISAAAFAFTVSLGEFGATALLTRPELVTLPVLIYTVLGRPGEVNQGQALALSTMLTLACGAGLAAIERFRARGAEGF